MHPKCASILSRTTAVSTTGGLDETGQPVGTNYPLRPTVRCHPQTSIPHVFALVCRPSTPIKMPIFNPGFYPPQADEFCFRTSVGPLKGSMMYLHLPQRKVVEVVEQAALCDVLLLYGLTLSVHPFL